MSNNQDKIPEEVRDRISEETEQYLKQGYYGSVEAIKLAVGKAYATAAQREYMRSQQQGPRWVKIEGGEQPLEYDHVLLYWEGLQSYATGSFINGKWLGVNKQPFWALPDYWAPLPPGPNESASPVTSTQEEKEDLGDSLEERIKVLGDHATALLSSAKEWGEKYAEATRELYRLRAKEDGYDDYCQAHGIPYDNECPECANLKYPKP